MRIEIYNTLSLLSEARHLNEQESGVLWQERVIKPFKSILEILPVDFTAMGASDFNTSIDVIDKSLEAFRANNIVERIEVALKTAFKAFEEKGDFPFPETLKVGVFVSNGKNIFQEQLNGGFSGFGGIPGFIILILSPTEYVLKNIEAITVHEFHHNIRNAIEPWPKDMNISVGQYLLVEGLAEFFAATLYGEGSIGSYTIGLKGEELEEAKQKILPHTKKRGFQIAQSYLFGDSLADIYRYAKIGLPHGAGYAVGYWLVKEYILRTGKDIFSATLETSERILSTVTQSSG